MKKTEIVNSVACSSVRPGAQLVEHSLPGALSFSHVTAANVGALEIQISRIFEATLGDSVKSLPEEPSPTLFEHLHQAALTFHTAQIGVSSVLGFDDEIGASHRRAIERLRELAQSHCIAYREPHDPLLED